LYTGIASQPRAVHFRTFRCLRELALLVAGLTRRVRAARRAQPIRLL